ncbi:MAG: hypothetical protein HY658_09550 [Actinobacteria bacterium]|nr:hypothetical protein [Actinomycetota bacterium]
MDLHVHTPAAPDMDSRWKDATPADLVAFAVARGLEVIAITDHNSVAWCDSVREAAAGTSLTVFPGVEVATQEGHLLVLFEPDAALSDLAAFLITLGFKGRSFDPMTALAKGDLPSVSEMARNEGALAIAAHIEKERGFWKTTERVPLRRQQIYACEAIEAFEITKANLREGFLGGDIPGYERQVACIQGSDSWPLNGSAHQLDAVGARYSYIKLDALTLDGVRHAFIDPELRIRFGHEPPSYPTDAIEGLWVTGGFLANEVLRFGHDVTCLIGGTGAGKSLSLELCRFALAQQVDGRVLSRIRTEIDGLLTAGLRPGDSVNVVVSKDGERYLVQRTWTGTESPDPVVWRIIDGELEDLSKSVHVPSFFPLKAFSQSEIIEYAREPAARLSLVDDLIDLSGPQRSAEQAK